MKCIVANTHCHLTACIYVNCVSHWATAAVSATQKLTTVLPATHLCIHKWNQACMLKFPSHRASTNFYRYISLIPLWFYNPLDTKRSFWRCTHSPIKRNVQQQKINTNKCSAVAEMGDHLATIDMDRKLGAVPLMGGKLDSHVTQCGLPSYQVAS